MFLCLMEILTETVCLHLVDSTLLSDGRDNIPGGIVPFRELYERTKYFKRVRFERDSGIGPLRLQYARSKERSEKEFDLRNWSRKDEDASSSKTCQIQGRYENWRSYSKKDQAFGDARVGIGCYWNRWFQ
ncbi:hypothetical protein H5410_064814 [Solanum commersonii]|uniref:Uncharacterized protein n=1 Tax=Solanum commersonii TaxID=4109 RepID=A0A9J5VYA9_SOLCO|nr:hypothetical protein H5410_064814 [Solanum commersonii]